ncbi:saccharopine dehydrogenase NADP-binding domain-containing protein [Nocardioides sp.]|uniref:saccharopine dehydrogenase family protein n=1 Tax=Nocardioides sp. TaxID=35761 RepID=UPI0031FE7A07|nr:Saccharopine dehydrogenase [Nocardioides sp.]
MTDPRELDVVLVGGTGFTGRLTATYLARRAPAGLKWALAGRTLSKLEALRARLAEIEPALADLELIRVDADDATALAALAERTKVVITAVGPYLAHGGPLLAACAAAGTDYVDLTGEPEFVDRMYVTHHKTAVASGARIVHACGFDSVPHDLGAYFAVQQLPDDRPITLRGVARATGGVSGGTFHSLLNAASRLGEMRSAVRARAAVEAAPTGRRSVAVTGKPHHDPVTGYWLLPAPAIDQAIVGRSGAALASYGPDFRYSHYLGMKHLPVLVGAGFGVGAVLAAAQVRPVRNLLLSRVPQGSGPSDKTRAAATFTVDFVGNAGGQQVHTRVSGVDPYDVSGVTLAESALSLALDDNPECAGQVTTAQAMGDHLMARLQAAGMRFEVVGSSA